MTGRSTILLTCEHAGRILPRSLDDLGLPVQEMDRHIAYDIGARELSRMLSEKLDAPLLMQRYSRLVVDCNRPFDAADCFPEVSDGTLIPANRSLSEEDRRERYRHIHVPFHTAVGGAISARSAAGFPVVLVSVHSFTRLMASTGDVRTCDLGLLFNRDPRFSHALMDAIRVQASAIRVEFNKPYLVDDESDYTVPVHGEAGNIPHVLLEVLNNHIEGDAGQRCWADILAAALEDAAVKTVGVSRIGRK
ncbi:MAG: hypothetical protein JWM58_2286 [Rhizobium sp.]|nr:hypothetical protein [Rhizobium sp.]